MKVTSESKVTLQLNQKEHDALFALLGNTSENDREQYVSEDQAQLLYDMWEDMNAINDESA